MEPELGPKDKWVVAQLDADDRLLEAFETAAQPWDRGVSVQELSDAYTVAGYWYAVSKDRKRREKNGDWQAEDFLQAQLVEDYMEALVKALDKSLMVAMHLGKRGGM